MSLLPLLTNRTMNTPILMIIDHPTSMSLIHQLEDPLELCPNANHIGGHSPVLEKLTFMESHPVKLTGRPLLT